jgi:hypothetical protein
VSSNVSLPAITAGSESNRLDASRQRSEQVPDVVGQDGNQLFACDESSARGRFYPQPLIQLGAVSHHPAPSSDRFEEAEIVIREGSMGGFGG